MFLLSATVVLLQVIVARVFAGLVYNRLHYFPISMAMLGLRGGGILLFAYRDRFDADAGTIARRYIRRALRASIVFVALMLGINHVGGRWIDGALGNLPDGELISFFFRTRVV